MPNMESAITLDQPRWRARAKKLVFIKLRLVIAGLLLGCLYAWAAPLAYPKDRPLGFTYGFIHGGLMPMALPSLFVKDVDIFAANNNGRFYKLGYICGINVCGMLFFGFGFGGIPKKSTPKQG